MWVMFVFAYLRVYELICLRLIVHKFIFASLFCTCQFIMKQRDNKLKSHKINWKNEFIKR